MSQEGLDREMENILDTSRAFVRKMTEGRDSSHGYDHMIRVSEISYEIWCKEIERGISPSPPILLVMVAALLHDVADHKYDQDGTLAASVQEFIQEDPRLLPFKIPLLWIIDNISWSKEKKNQGKNLERFAGTVVGYARDIVSDADKSCALGEEGYLRTKKYAQDRMGIVNPHEIKSYIREHADEKLLRLLPDGYFRTATGRERAQLLHEELQRLLV